MCLCEYVDICVDNLRGDKVDEISNLLKRLYL